MHLRVSCTSSGEMEEDNASSFLPFKYGSAMRLVLTGLLSIVVALLQNIKTASLSAILCIEKRCNLCF